MAMQKLFAIGVCTFLILGCTTVEDHAVPAVALETTVHRDSGSVNDHGPAERGVLNVAVENWSQPNYPQEAKDERVEGFVYVRVKVDKDGDVSHAQAESGHPLLRMAAEEWAKERRIQPYRLEGSAVESTGILVVKFGK